MNCGPALRIVPDVTSSRGSNASPCPFRKGARGARIKAGVAAPHAGRRPPQSESLCPQALSKKRAERSPSSHLRFQKAVIAALAAVKHVDPVGFRVGEDVEIVAQKVELEDRLVHLHQF